MTTTTAIFVGGALDGTIRSLEGRPPAIVMAIPCRTVSWGPSDTLPDPWKPKPLLRYRDTGAVHPDGYRIYRLGR